MAVLRVKTSFASGRRVYQQGEVVDAVDPIVAGKEALFEAPEEAVVQAEPEADAPAEKRPTTRRRTTK